MYLVSERMLYLVTEYASGGEIFGKFIMESERMLYLVTEYASGGELFGKFICQVLFRGCNVLCFSSSSYPF